MSLRGFQDVDGGELPTLSRRSRSLGSHHVRRTKWLALVNAAAATIAEHAARQSARSD